MKSIISLIVPVYKKEKVIKECLTRQYARLSQVCEKMDLDFELIVVIDGRLDKSEEIAKNLNLKCLTVVSYKENKGKGYAVRYGMKHSKGDYIGFIDAGLDIDPKVIEDLVFQIVENPDIHIVVASKKHPESKLIYSLKRKIFTFVYSLLVKICTGLDFKDTQVGAKMFSRELIDKVLPRLSIDGFAFDIEILAIADKLGYRKHIDVPVEVNLNLEHSKAAQVETIFQMIRDTANVGYRVKRLERYDD